MTDRQKLEYPLKATIERIFGDLQTGVMFEPTGLNREFYLDMA